MILYKYVTASTAKSIMDKQAIAFSRMHTLNDPFEMHAICNYKRILESTKLKVGDQQLDESILPYYINESCGVLSLTRNPLNLIMWSHYADNHQGVVIGLDIKECGFCDEGENIIPAQLGDVIYTRDVPKLIDWTTCEPVFTCANSYKQIISEYGMPEWGFFKGVFLYKGYDWAYEEEVRVVKKLDGTSCWESVWIKDDGDNLMDINSHINIYKIPLSAIKEIYLGARFPVDDVLKYIPSSVAAGAKIKLCKVKNGEYSLGVSDFKQINITKS